MRTASLAERTLTGAAAGVVATGVLQRLRTAIAARFPDTTPPLRQEAGEFIVGQVERRLPKRVQRAIPERAEQLAAASLALGYGVTFGALYGLARKRPGRVLTDGAALGLVTWAAGYLGWLPATGLMPPITKQKPAQVVTPILQHVLFGIVAVAVVRGVSRRTEPA